MSEDIVIDPGNPEKIWICNHCNAKVKSTKICPVCPNHCGGIMILASRIKIGWENNDGKWTLGQ